MERSGQCRPFGAALVSTNRTEEKRNGQGSIKKQPREEEAETGEGKTYGRRIAVFGEPAEARLFIGQETVDQAAVVKYGILDHLEGYRPQIMR
jgi:hypothetical protein